MVTKTKRESRLQPVELEDAGKTEIFTEVEVSPNPLPWLTLETLLYIVIFVVAVALRLGRLGAYPLSEVEAQQSLVAWRLYHGDTLQASYYSPLLASLNALSFLLFGDSDASARLASVLFGSGLVILPLTLRRQLGSLVCLLAAGVLEISPIAIYLSRTLNSEIAVAAGALMIVAGFFNWAEDGQQRWLVLAAGGLAVLLAAGTTAYSILVIFALIVLIKLSAFKSLWRQGLAFTAGVTSATRPGQDDQQPEETTLGKAAASQASVYVIPNPAANASGQTKDNHTVEAQPADVEASAADSHQGRARVKPQDQSGKLSTEQTAHLRQAAFFFGAALVLLSTAALFNLSGFSMLTASVGDWLNRFNLQAQSNAGFNAVFLLTIYEPLLVFAGLTGLTFVLMHGNFPASILGGWFVGVLLLDVIMLGRPNSNAILALVPLAFLAAFALAELWQSVRDKGTWSNEGVLLAAGVAIASFGYIGLTGWLIRTCGSEDLACQYAWLQSAAAFFLFIVIVIFFAVMGDSGAALRGALLVAVAVSLLSTVSVGWRLNYGPLRHLAFQPLSGIPASTELVALTDTLTEQSEQRAGDSKLLDVTLAGVNSLALQWQLRDYKYLNQNPVTEGALSTTIITPAETDLNIGESYIGQDFALDAIWSPVGLQPKELINWLIYRYSDQPLQGNKVILWMRLDPSKIF